MAQKKYSDVERAAVMAALEAGTKPRTISDLAAAGELRDAGGSPLSAFEIPDSTVRDLRRRAHRQRTAETRQLSDAPTGDAVEQMRRRLVARVNEEIRVLERRKRGALNFETARQAARALDALSRITPPENRPTAPLAPGDTDYARTLPRGGLAGSLMRAHLGNGPREPLVPVAQAAPLPAPEPVAPEPEPENEVAAWARAEVERVAEATAEAERVAAARAVDVDHEASPTPSRKRRRVRGWEN